MRQAANSLPNTPEAPAGMPFDLMGVIAPYRQHRRLTLRVEKLPQRARLSAGRNNGDNSWSLDLQDLEGLSYYPPEGFDKEHTLTIRVILHENGEASAIAAVDFRVPPADERGNATPSGPVGLADKKPPEVAAPDRALREEVLTLKAMLAAQHTQLEEMRASGEALDARWQQKLQESLMESERARNADEALRLNEATAALQAQFERDLSDIKQHTQTEARQHREREAATLRKSQQDLADAKAALAGQEREQSQLRSRLADLQQASAAEISAAKKAAALDAVEKLKAAEAAWQLRAAKSLAEVTERCQAAETALASARAMAATKSDDGDAYIAGLQREIESLRQALSDQRGEQEAALPGLQQKLTEANAALASREQEQRQMLGELAALREASAAEISAARNAAALEAAEKLKAAEAAWQERAARSLAEITERCQEAETALASARAALAKRPDDDAYVHGLQREIGSLRKALVDREADLARTKASLEQLRFDPTSYTPATNWQPLSNRPQTREAKKAPANNHLARDVVIIFVVVIAAVLLWPQIESMLPDDLFGSQTESEPAPVQRPPALPHAPKLEPPMATVARAVNVRAEPSVGAAVLTSLSRGEEVAILGQSGNWDHVAISGADGKTLQGWVYASYLAVQPAKTPNSQTGAP